MTAVQRNFISHYCSVGGGGGGWCCHWRWRTRARRRQRQRGGGGVGQQWVLVIGRRQEMGADDKNDFEEAVKEEDNDNDDHRNWTVLGLF